MSGVDCPRCGKSCKTGRGFSIHWGKQHEGPKPEAIDTSMQSETKQKISEAMSGRTVTWGDKIAEGNRGKSLTEETKRKMSEAQKRAWQSGAYDGVDLGPDADETSDYPSEWTVRLRDQIRRRDQYRCQDCLKPQYKSSHWLHTHHIDGNKQNCDTDNLIALCPTCHAARHT